MRKRVKVALAVMLAALFCVGAWQLFCALGASLEDARAWSILTKARNPPLWFVSERDKRAADCAMRLLGTRESSLRKPYMALKSNAPLKILSRMPDWPEPRYIRRTAA